MAETCIVCLGDLRTSPDEETPTGAAAISEARQDDDDAAIVGSCAKNSLRNTRLSSKSAETDEEIVAHLLPCKHDLHNACLKPWVERANSCPICRATFNMVEISRHIGGEVIDSYAVKDKVQEAEIDPTLVIEDELFTIDTLEPCLVCGAVDDVHEVMYCDGCDKAVHVFCAGFEDSPDVWYCETCLIDMEGDAGVPGLRAASRQRTRARTGASQRHGRRHDAIWARVWQEVSQRLDLDLDFPFDDELSDHRTEEQRREFARWQRRFEVADRQGSANNLRRGIAARLQPRGGLVAPPPESQEELRAWNAFDKARELQDTPETNTRKRKSTASPHSPQEPGPSEQRQLKRPRLRRPHVAVDQPQVAESSHAAAQRVGDEPTFLSSLLREVAQKPISAGSPGASEQNNHFSPRNSSPVRSPASSGYATPRALSVTPPPQQPNSPPILSALLSPSPPGLNFSPFSPAETHTEGAAVELSKPRGRSILNRNEAAASSPRADSSSPGRGLSYSSKEEIQRMVKLALGSRYRDKSISKDQYTDINRDVSRKMYELIGGTAALTDQQEREKWQRVAEEEVRRAIAEISLSPAGG